MSAGWVAAGVRGRALLRRRLGAAGARGVAASPSLADAVVVLAATPYRRELRTGMELAAAQHAVAATTLWHLRVLAGWGPPLGSGPLRILAGGFEIANVSSHLARLAGHPAPTPYGLGSLASAWPSVSAAGAPGDVRAALRSSPWGDPGSDDPAAVRLSLQLGWARRVLDGVPGAADWAVSAAGLVLGRVLATEARSVLGPSAHRDLGHLLGPHWQRARSLADLGRQVPPAAARALRGVADPADLWRAEVRWWRTVEAAGTALVARPRPDPSVGVGVAALLAADAWRVRAALAVAARGGGELTEVLDAVA